MLDIKSSKLWIFIWF